MFNYTNDVVIGLLVLSVVLGAFFAYAKAKYHNMGIRIALVGTITGIIFSFIYAFVGLKYRIPKEYVLMLTLLHIVLWSFLIFIILTIITSIKKLKEKTKRIKLSIKYKNYKKKRIISLANKREKTLKSFEELKKNDPNALTKIEKRLAKEEEKKKKNPEKYRKYDDSELASMPDIKIFNFDLATLFDAITMSILSLMVAVSIVINLTNVIRMPFNDFRADDGILSNYYLVFLAGYILGFIIIGLVIAGLIKVLNIITDRKSKYFSYIIMFLSTSLIWFISLINTISKTYSYYRNTRAFFKRIIIFGDNIYRQILKIDANYKILTFIASGILVLAIVFYLYTLRTTKMQYKNNAERRIIKAGWLSGIRWSVIAASSILLGILSMTALYKTNDNTIVVAEVESPIIIHDYDTYVDIDGFEETIDNGYVYIPYSMVEDGHLHRFGYETLDGYNTRVIVVLKPNMTYGVGLDACETCGEAGYYERDGDIICKRCDVVMNKATIGMKGGCNPIVISYEEGTYEINGLDMECIRIPIPELVKYQMKFSK